MRLGKAAAYGVYATVHIAERYKKKPIQGDAIAESCGIPASHLMKVLQQLVRARILESERGPNGGFSLRRDPGSITLLEIIEAIDGPIMGDVAGSRDVTGKNTARARVISRCNDVAKYARTQFAKSTVRHLVK
jgi:Rrf2 family protein